MKHFLIILLAVLWVFPAFAQTPAAIRQDDPQYEQESQKFIDQLSSCTTYQATTQQPLSNDPNAKMKAEIFPVGNTCHYKLDMTNVVMDCSFNMQQLQEIKAQGTNRLNQLLVDKSVCPYTLKK